MIRLSKHILLGMVAVMLFMGGHAEAQQKTQTASPKIQPDYSSEIREIQIRLDEINDKLTEAQKASVGRDELGNLRVEIGNSKQAFYDSQVNWLNVFIGFFTLVLTGFSILAAILGWWGFGSFKALKKAAEKQLKDAQQRYDQTVKDVVKNVYLRLIRNIYPLVKESPEAFKENIKAIFAKISDEEAQHLFSKEGPFGSGGSEGLQDKLYRELLTKYGL